MIPYGLPPLFGSSAIDMSTIFNTTLWTGTGAIRTITTGLNYTSRGGLVWIKQRSATQNHALFDTTRGALFALGTNLNGDGSLSLSGTLTAFGSSGFNLGSADLVNKTGETYVGWSFLESSSFFDIVTYTGTGVSRTVSHNLGVVPGWYVVKKTSGGGQWKVYHRSLLNTQYLILDKTDPAATVDNSWNSTTATSSVFSLGLDNDVNQNGSTYIAYLFAQSDLIDCGSYTGNGSATGPVVTLGWQPQWLMVKRSNSSGNWRIYDNVRSPTNPRSLTLLPNSDSSEDTSGENLDFLSTGFQPKSTAQDINASGSTYIYVAIRSA